MPEKLYDDKVIAYIPKEWKIRLRMIARKKKCSVSHLVREIIKNYLYSSDELVG